MKKIFLVTAVAFFAIITAQAQVFRFGAKAGANFASLNGDDVDNFDGKTSIHVGGVARISISELLAVQPELLYSRQGAKNSDDDKLFLDYINIPILVDFTLADGLSLQGGPQIGININGIAKDGDSGNEVDIEDVETLDLGVGIGAQYILPINLFFQARYVIGFRDAVKDVDAKNSVIGLSVGYFFN